MMNIENNIFSETNIFDLAPKITKKEFNEVLQTIDKLFIKYILLNYRYLRYFERIDTMLSEELDLLAEELDVDFYDFELTLTEKRELCKTAFAIQSIKGTPSSIKKILNTFYKNSRIIEFPEFNGDAGTFKIEINGISNEEKINQIINRVNLTKKHSQHLNGIKFKNIIEVKIGKNILIKQGKKAKLIEAPFEINLNHMEVEIKTGISEFKKVIRRQ